MLWRDGSRLAIVAVYQSTAAYKKPREGLTADREFSAYLEKICNEFKSVVICGDLNIPEMNWKNHSFRMRKENSKDQLIHYLDLTSELNLAQSVLEPTRQTNTLEVVFNMPMVDLLITKTVVNPITSDHKHAVHCQVRAEQLKIWTQDDGPTFKLNFHKSDITKLKII